jgi:hypothetical protein
VRLSRRERGLVAAQIDGQCRNLLRLSQALHRLARDERLSGGFEIPVAAIRPWSDGVSTVPGQIALQRTPLRT